VAPTGLLVGSGGHGCPRQRPAALLPHHSADAAGPAPDAWTACSLDELRLRLQSFAAERDWDKFHTPRNLALALVGEVGELCECFQWKGDHGAPLHLPDWPADKKTHLGEELSGTLCTAAAHGPPSVPSLLPTRSNSRSGLSHLFTRALPARRRP